MILGQIPPGLMHVKENVEDEVKQLARERYVRTSAEEPDRRYRTTPRSIRIRPPQIPTRTPQFPTAFPSEAIHTPTTGTHS
jgi:hypothetical protein